MWPGLLAGVQDTRALERPPAEVGAARAAATPEVNLLDRLLPRRRDHESWVRRRTRSATVAQP